jgi:uncharacterized protein
VLIELERRRCEVTYVRTPDGSKVDFLARLPEGGEELIQVCTDLSNPDTAEREIRALLEARTIHPRATARVLTLNREPSPAETLPGLIVQPAYEWMLMH